MVKRWGGPRPLWVVLGLAVGLMGGLLVFVRQPAEPLTVDRLEAARRLWEGRKPASYTFEVETQGATAGRYRIEVREDEVVNMTTGGAQAAPSAWAYWTVEGLFGFLQKELENAARPQASFGVEDTTRVVLRARFDPHWGYPAFFLRHVMGTRQGIEWRVVRFEPAQG